MSELPPEVDTSRPHPARIYDNGLGGKNRCWRPSRASAG
jgi:hypothetical protein